GSRTKRVKTSRAVAPPVTTAAAAEMRMAASSMVALMRPPSSFEPEGLHGIQLRGSSSRGEAGEKPHRSGCAKGDENTGEGKACFPLRVKGDDCRHCEPEENSDDASAQADEHGLDEELA